MSELVKSGPSRRRWLPALSAILGLAVTLHAQPRRDDPNFRAGVDLVSLNVTVTGPSGIHVGHLTAEDFDIFEDGRPQEVTFFSREHSPLTVSLLLDSSASMRNELRMAQAAATEFVARLQPQDLVEIIDFDARIEVVQSFTNERAALEKAIDRLSIGGLTSLHNAVYVALRRIGHLRAKSPDEIRREVIVVLSDGEDTSSIVTFEELLDVAKRSQTAVYSIRLGSDENRRKGKYARGAATLRSLSHETGGRLFSPRHVGDLSSVYSEIADELASQYVIGYLSANVKSDRGWRQVSVRMRQPNMRARTRSGYYAVPRKQHPSH